jgi:hypothetical protein
MRSKYLPKHLKKDYERAVTDPDLLSLRDQAALLRTREMELIRQLGQMEVPPWGRAVDALVTLENAMRDKHQVKEAWANLSNVIRQGASSAGTYEATWEELRAIIQEETKVSQTEVRRMLAVGAFVRTEDLMTVLRGMLEAVRANVPEVKARQAIQSRFNQLIEVNGQLPVVEVVDAAERN